MDLQTPIVVLLVPACAGYAMWKLAPLALKRSAARGLLRMPLPTGLARVLQRTARAGGACGCDGCDAAPPARPGVTPVTLHRRTPQR